MKKLFVLATAAFLVTGIAFAHEGDGKKCAKGKECCKDKKRMQQRHERLQRHEKRQQERC